MSSYQLAARYAVRGLPPVDDLFAWPIMSLPEVYFPPSPSPTSTSSASSPPVSPPQPVHVVCNAPLVAPIPLPYHSPTFLQFDLLPDIDQDLSRPPYTRRSSKRKRTSDEAPSEQVLSKKCSLPPSSASHSHRCLPNNRLLRHHTTHNKRASMHTHT